MLLVKQELLAALANTLDSLSPGAGTNAAFESPKVAAHGDFASTAAMQLAKPLGRKPRELAEELAIDVEQACLAPACFASDMLGDRHLLLLLYVCRKWRGTPTPQHASALRWARPVELHGLAMPPADKPLIGLLEALI